MGISPCCEVLANNSSRLRPNATPWKSSTSSCTPGGGTDTVTRHIANTITQDTQWTFLIDNKAGGGGNIGLDMAAQLAAEGSAPLSGDPAQVAKYLKAEQAEWGKLIRDAGIKLE